ncbi:MAG TPA: HAMP domain-containing sensor histidine kinase, partial [Gemmatimonadaceae bacterium]|nr:HAMP domain-containing sensor histidine kinase [Gemmatimonadaceae bacterium]
REGMMSDKSKGYGTALLASSVAFVVVVLLSRILPFEPFLLFAVPVVLIARYVGRGPTVLTVILSTFAIEAAVILNGHLPHGEAGVWLHVAVFAIVAYAIDSSTHALHTARRDAEHSAERLVEVNMELEQQVEEVQVLSEDLHSTNQSLADARDVAENASRARAEMLAIVAHDLRNPLNVVMIARGLLADKEFSVERRDQLLAVMQRATQRMNRLVEDLLEVVRQESGKMTLVLEEASVTHILEQTVEMCGGTAREHDISLEVHEAPQDLLVIADEERIMQVMGNLVGNALKFVPRGGSVVLECERKGDEAVFAVIDSGPGIPPEDLEHLFEKFWQRRRSDHRGVGLGLAIARGIIEAHGGRIWAESTVGSGSTFYFTLPAVKQPDANALPDVDAPMVEEAVHAAI